MKCLITGGCGYTGSLLAKKLLQKGYKVEIVDDLSTGSLSNLDEHGVRYRVVLPGLMSHLQKNSSSSDSVLVVTSDFTDDEFIRNTLEKKYDYIFHLADNTDVEFCNTRISESTDTNLYKTVALAHLATKSCTKMFIFASANERLCRNNSYDFVVTQKLACEMFLRQFYNQWNLSSAAIRLSENIEQNADALLSYALAERAGAFVYNADLELE